MENHSKKRQKLSISFCSVLVVFPQLLNFCLSKLSELDVTLMPFSVSLSCPGEVVSSFLLTECAEEGRCSILRSFLHLCLLTPLTMLVVGQSTSVLTIAAKYLVT